MVPFLIADHKQENLQVYSNYTVYLYLQAGQHTIASSHNVMHAYMHCSSIEMYTGTKSRSQFKVGCNII